MKLERIDTNGSLQGYVLVKSCDKKTAKNGSQYLDMLLYDGEEDIVGKVWSYMGSDEEMPKINTVVLVRGSVSVYNSQQQLKIDRIRGVEERDNGKYNMSDFIPSACYEPEYMYGELISLADSFEDAELKRLTKAVYEATKPLIINLPAAYRLHHAIRGGLLMHTLSICRLCESVAALYPSVDRDLLIAGAMLHDIAKTEEFDLAASGLVNSYTVRGTLIGHLVGGAMLIDGIGKKEGVDPDTLMLLEHMLISHHGEPEFGAAVRPLTLEAEILSSLDKLDADIYEIEAAVATVPAGGFTNKLWALDDRKFYNSGRKTISAEVRFKDK